MLEAISPGCQTPECSLGEVSDTRVAPVHAEGHLVWVSDTGYQREGCLTPDYCQTPEYFRCCLTLEMRWCLTQVADADTRDERLFVGVDAALYRVHGDLDAAGQV